MTGSTQELDEILWSAIMHEPAPTKPGEEFKATWNEPVIAKAKQAILAWHNKQTEGAEKKAYQHAYMVMTDADLTEVQALDCLLKLSGNAGLIFSEAERNKLKESGND